MHARRGVDPRRLRPDLQIQPVATGVLERERRDNLDLVSRTNTSTVALLPLPGGGGGGGGVEATLERVPRGLFHGRGVEVVRPAVGVGLTHAEGEAVGGHLLVTAVRRVRVQAGRLGVLVGGVVPHGAQVGVISPVPEVRQVDGRGAGRCGIGQGGNLQNQPN